MEQVENIGDTRLSFEHYKFPVSDCHQLELSNDQFFLQNQPYSAAFCVRLSEQILKQSRAKHSTQTLKVQRSQGRLPDLTLQSKHQTKLLLGIVFQVSPIHKRLTIMEPFQLKQKIKSAIDLVEKESSMSKVKKKIKKNNLRFGESSVQSNSSFLHSSHRILSTLGTGPGISYSAHILDQDYTFITCLYSCEAGGQFFKLEKWRSEGSGVFFTQG